MNLNALLRRHQISLMVAQHSMSARDRRAHEQFARDYAEHIRNVRAALGARPARRGSIT